MTLILGLSVNQFYEFASTLTNPAILAFSDPDPGKMLPNFFLNSNRTLPVLFEQNIVTFHYFYVDFMASNTFKNVS
jgi:hypothetical protein